jgi:hypothetical protein
MMADLKSGLNWLIRAGERRVSRLHDYERRRVSFHASADLPVVLIQAARRKLSGQLPVLPWIPYPALRRLEEIIQPGWCVLESGSGNSTIWLARRVSRIRSVESDPLWYARVSWALHATPATVDYRYVDSDRSPEQYWEIETDEQARYDLVIVDGLFREACTNCAIQAVRPGGYIYLDNIDTAGATAFTLLKDAVRSYNGTIELFTGFPPGQPSVTTGALAQLHYPPEPRLAGNNAQLID